MSCCLWAVRVFWCYVYRMGWLHCVLQYTGEKFWRNMFLGLAGLLLLQYAINVMVMTHHPRARLWGVGITRQNNSKNSEKGVSSVVHSYVGNLLTRLGFKRATPLPPLVPCPFIPPNLTGPVAVSFERLTFEEIELSNPELSPGGRWSPPECSPMQKVALIVPYRDREDHLRIWLHNIHPYLQKQQLDYGIFIIEQDNESTFNRGLLMNIGFLEAQKEDNYSCFIFHDVDLLPEDDRNLYKCSSQPRHVSASVDAMSYRLPYEGLFGGVEAFRKDHFQKVNGFSNKFFGWGGEDDDLYNRMQFHGLNLTRFPMRISRYRMIRHLKRDPSPNRFKYLNTGKSRYLTDGLSSITYKRVQLDRRKLYTLVSVKINATAVLAKDKQTELEIEYDVIANIRKKIASSKKSEATRLIAQLKKKYGNDPNHREDIVSLNNQLVQNNVVAASNAINNKQTFSNSTTLNVHTDVRKGKYGLKANSPYSLGELRFRAKTRFKGGMKTAPTVDGLLHRVDKLKFEKDLKRKKGYSQVSRRSYEEH